MMLSSISFTALAAALSLTFENVAPASARRLSRPDSEIENSYIIKLKDGVNTTSHINSLPFPFAVEDENSPITHFWPEFFVGYSGIFVGTALDAIRASPDVEYVEKNGIMRIADSQTNAPWNLQSISSRQPVGGTNTNTQTYTYLYTQPIGAGVDIYIVDTGVDTTHDEFGDRASFPWAAPGLVDVDIHGHGTHIAGIAAGITYGVAKKANIIGVKVLDGYDIGTNDNTISGINWVADNFRSTRRPSIACLALNGPHSQGVDDATAILINNGVTVITAAGNNGQDAAGTSPAGAPNVFVVGASDITNAIWPSSNYGSLVDLFAPGVSIISAWITGPTSTAVGSGTSQACAHVAGIAAHILSLHPTLSPAGITGEMLGLATVNAINNVPPATDNELVFNNAGTPP